MRKNKTLRIAAFIMIILACVFLTSCESRASRAQRIIDETAMLIPKFAKFYEENEDFFDLLLDLQSRYAESTRQSFHISFSINQNQRDAAIQVNSNVRDSTHAYISCELKFIESTLHELDAVMQGYHLFAMIRDDRVVVRFWTVKNQIYLALASPVMYGAELGGDSTCTQRI